MSEGTIRFFNKGLEAVMTGEINLSATFRIALLSAGYTFNADVTSYDLSLSSLVCEGSGGKANRQIGVGIFTQEAKGIFTWDLPDVAVSASAGSFICAQHAILLQSAVDTPLAYFLLSTGEAAAKQIIIQWP